MNEAIQIMMKSDNLDLPACSAVYAIFSASKCRFVGLADNLQEHIKDHFKTAEPNISLRYFMQSYKPKILQYEVLGSALSLAQRELMKEKWIRLYQPTDNIPSRFSEAPHIHFQKQRILQTAS